LRSLGTEAELTRDPARILAADRVVLPGVGAFGKAAERLCGHGLDETITTFIETGRPFLGICVGMQILMEEGHEFGAHRGLGVIPGTVEKIDIRDAAGQPLRVPVIGWSPIEAPVEPGTEVFRCTPFQDMQQRSAFYFVHAFAARPRDPATVLATVTHAGEPVTAAIRKDNVIGVQFHPERSAETGLALLDRFLKL
jgi:glutamine amidotransferase